MFHLLSLLTIIIPSLGMIAGLVNSLTISLFLIISLFLNKEKINFSLKKNKLEIIFLIWCFFSCWWAIHSQSSFFQFFQFLILILIGIILNNNIKFNPILANSIYRSLLIGISLSLILFLIEFNFSGLITIHFKELFQKDAKYKFYLHNLDRGCALLSTVSWIIIGILAKQKKYLLTSVYYICIIILLSFSDSLASLVAFLIASSVFLIGKIIYIKIFRLINFIIIIGSLFVPLLAYNLPPYEFSNKYLSFLPLSAKHRLFIWNHTAHKIERKPILGWGFGSSKNVKINDEEPIYYEGHSLSPFPLHPHNNILQITFETGIIGLLLFLSIIYKYLKNLGNFLEQDSTYGLASYACFINYYVIGMISFSIWQTWWVCSGIWVAILMKIFFRPFISSK